MRHTIEAGTDVASLLLFDPHGLPDDFDKRSPSNAYTLLGELTNSGRAYLLDTGADGGYLLHAFVDEGPADYLQPFVKDPKVVERFAVPSGALYFSGIEYAFRHNDSRLRKHPGMGGCVLVTPGTYHLTLYRTEYPEEMMEDDLRKVVTSGAFRLHQNMGLYVGLAVLGLIATVVLFFKLSLGSWLAVVLPVCLVLISVPIVIANLPLYRRTEAVWREIQRKYPSIVAVLRRTP